MSKFSNLKINFDPLTEYQKEVLTGCMLGDAFLMLGHESIHPCLKIHRKLEDRKYLEWQRECFSNFCISDIKDGSYVDKRTNKTYYYCYFLTRNIPEFLPHYHKWYVEGVKIVPRDIELTPLIAAIWFADDGSMKHLGKSELKMKLSTDGFTHSDVLFLASLLKSTLKIDFRIQQDGISKKGAPQYVIHGSSASTYTFIKYMEKEFANLFMDRKNCWNGINIDIPAQAKRSSNYYKMADFLLTTESFSGKDFLALELYSDIDSVNVCLRNFYKRGFITRKRIFENRPYIYSLTDSGKQFFHSLQQEQHQLYIKR